MDNDYVGPAKLTQIEADIFQKEKAGNDRC